MFVWGGIYFPVQRPAVRNKSYGTGLPAGIGLGSQT